MMGYNDVGFHGKIRSSHIVKLPMLQSRCHLSSLWSMIVNVMMLSDVKHLLDAGGTVPVLMPLVYTLRSSVLVDSKYMDRDEVEMESNKSNTLLGRYPFISAGRDLSATSQEQIEVKPMINMMVTKMVMKKML